MRSDFQMVNTTAPPIVATVHDNHAFGNFPVRNEPRQSMRAELFSTVFNLTVSSGEDRGPPFPAITKSLVVLLALIWCRAVFIYKSPESLLVFLAEFWDGFCSVWHISSVLGVRAIPVRKTP